MSLTWKDIITTLIASGVVLLAVAVAKNWDVPIIGNARVAALVMIIAGIVMCTLGGTTLPADSTSVYSVIMGILGGAVVIAGLLALIFGTAWLTITTAIILVIMWAVATARHIFWA